MLESLKVCGFRRSSLSRCVSGSHQRSTSGADSYEPEEDYQRVDLSEFRDFGDRGSHRDYVTWQFSRVAPRPTASPRVELVTKVRGGSDCNLLTCVIPAAARHSRPRPLNQYRQVVLVLEDELYGYG